MPTETRDTSSPQTAAPAAALGQEPQHTIPQRAYYIDRAETLHKKRLYWIGRRAQDILFSLIALIVLAPFMLLVALIIWIDSPGASPIFAQERVGRDGKRFKFLKFRSMVPNAEDKLDDLMDQNEMDGPVFKMRDDPRITRVGHIIRKTSIDELPQLLNILKGDMSIVGAKDIIGTTGKTIDFAMISAA